MTSSATDVDQALKSRWSRAARSRSVTEGVSLGVGQREVNAGEKSDPVEGADREAGHDVQARGVDRRQAPIHFLHARR